MKKLILHIGTEKTGTTTIQEFLYLNRNKLLEHDIYFPLKCGKKNNRKLATICMLAGKSDDHHKALKLDTPQKIENWKVKSKEEMLIELINIKEPTTIITSEHFSSRLTSVKEVQNLYDILSPIFDEIEVVLYIRRQDKYAVSLYSTALKEGLTHREILPKQKIKERYDYFQVCTLWESVFKNITVKLFEKKELKNNDLIQDFLELVNLDKDVSDFQDINSANPSINAAAQDFLISWNKLKPKYTPKGVNPDHIKVVTYLEDNYKGSPRLPLRGYVLNWMKDYLESNRKVAKKYFNGRSELFSNDFNNYPTDIESTLDIKTQLISIAFEVNDFLKNE